MRRGDVSLSRSDLTGSLYNLHISDPVLKRKIFPGERKSEEVGNRVKVEKREGGERSETRSARSNENDPTHGSPTVPNSYPTESKGMGR